MNGIRGVVRWLNFRGAKGEAATDEAQEHHTLAEVLPFLAGFLLLLTLTRLALKVMALEADENTQSFVGYYTASVLLLGNDIGPQVYDNNWFIQQVKLVSQQPDASEIFAPTLPTVVLLALPFAWLPLQVAHAAWLWTNFLILLLSLGILVLACRQIEPGSTRPLWWWGLLAAFGLSFRPTLNNFEVNQSILIFLGLFTLTLLGLVSGRDWLAGLTLGLAFVLKMSGLALWFLFLVQRRWQALAWGLAVIATGMILTLPWIGLATWVAYLQALLNTANSPTRTVTAYQSTAGFFAHFLVYDATWNQNPLTHWPALAQILTLLVTGITLPLTLWLGRDRVRTPLFFAALLPLSLVLLPVASEQHMVMYLISIFILANELHSNTARDFFSLDWLLLGLAILLLMAPIPYKDPVLGVGWLALLAYPRLYGSWLLWLVAVRRLARYQPKLKVE